MMKLIFFAVSLALAASPCLAQTTGARLIPGSGIDISTSNVISTKLPPKDQSAGPYTILAGDNAFLLEVGASGATLPQAGSAGFLANWEICIINVGVGNATVATTTSIFRGAGETTSLLLAPGGWACPESNGTNWITTHRRGNPVITDATQARTLGAFECDSTVFFTSASAVTVTLAATAPPSCNVDVVQGGAGQLTFAISGSSTLSSFDGFTRTAGLKAGVSVRVMTNTGSNAAWYLFGRGAP